MPKRKAKRCSFRGTFDVRTPGGLARVAYSFDQACGLPFEKFRTQLTFADGYEWIAFRQDAKGRPSSKRITSAMSKAKRDLYEEYERNCGKQVVAPIRDAAFVCAPVCKPRTKPCGRACIPKSKRCRQPVPKAGDVAACNTVERFGMHEADARELRKLMGQDVTLPSRARRGVFGARRG
jgi:hypothetical protein